MKNIIKIESTIDLLTEIKKGNLIDFFYRGHSKSEWDLIPTIGRYRKPNKYYPKWLDLEEDILENFQKYSMPFLSYKPKNKYEWLVIAQHHGLPTHILDWTTNPLKALFFSVEDPNYGNHDAALWAFRPKGFFNSLTKLHELHGDNFNSFFSYYPDNLNPRIISQESCFTFFPLPENTENNIPPLNNNGVYKDHVSNIIKFEIKNTNKDFIKEELQQLGISHRTLFPDLDGLSKSIRRDYGYLC